MATFAYDIALVAIRIRNPENIEISFLDNEDSFTDMEWKNLYKLSEDTFVDETDSLKHSAAGAGLTDND